MVSRQMWADNEAYPKELEPRFQYLERFRRTLDDLVPLYMPASDVSDDTLREFARLGERTRDAEIGGSAKVADRLTRERSALVSFFPVIEHALGENADKGTCHFQMMTEFHTIAEIAAKLWGNFGSRGD